MPSDDASVQPHPKDTTPHLSTQSSKGVAAHWPRFLKIGFAMAVVGLSLGIADFTRRNRLAKKYLLTQRIIAEQIEQFLLSPDVLRLAARQRDISQGNGELADCILGGGVCTATDPHSQVAFGLRSNMDVHSDLLVGTESHPARYSQEGSPHCSVLDDHNCPGWVVKAWFWAECEGGQKSCRMAKTIHVRYQVAPGISLDNLPALPLTEVLESDPYAYSKPVSMTSL